MYLVQIASSVRFESGTVTLGICLVRPHTPPDQRCDLFASDREAPLIIEANGATCRGLPSLQFASRTARGVVFRTAQVEAGADSDMVISRGRRSQNGGAGWVAAQNLPQ